MLNYIKAGCAAIIFISTFQLRARVITVAIASESRQKIDAVEAAFGQKFPDDTINYVACKTSSFIPNQPVGIDAAKRGVKNRLESISKDLLDSADYIVSIENYIEQSIFSGSWYDRGLILFRDRFSETMLLTRPVFISDEYVKLARQMSDHVSDEGYTITVGCAIQKSLSDRVIDPQDWHKEVEFGGISRSLYLQDTLYKALRIDKLDFLKSFVVTHVDFPKPGIVFSDFLPILSDSVAFQTMIDLLVERYKMKGITAIVGLESRGFILGSALACRLGVGFVPVRKPGKLPGQTYSVSYKKEYGTDTLVISQNALLPNQRVIIIDDLIATGGSARAAIELVEKAGGKVVEFVSILKIEALEEQAKLPIASFNLID